ncbi:MAG: hypothetical protein HY852_07435 [Bradyrhizobium sp.]|uniref:hypothetical protein n=1 Tax=Bradyrhizobium sp. TaxID=376 RepID=UPI0025C5FBEB|nr:hypothetical protein [Bradyrhizobium sp.]MBI5261634.1 hypothetical protein [Bradyrhizobium sp.]
MIGGHFAYPDLPHHVGQVMFWLGIFGLVLWLLAHLGAFDRLPFMARFSGHAPAPTRDTKISEAIAYICYLDWGKSFLMAAGDNPPTEAVEALKSFRQAAADGHVQIWGKVVHGDVYEPIDADYWRSYQIEWFSLLRGQTITEPAVVGVKRGSEYVDLMVSKSQIEAVWPRKRRKIRLQKPWTVKDA